MLPYFHVISSTTTLSLSRFFYINFMVYHHHHHQWLLGSWLVGWGEWSVRINCLMSTQLGVGYSLHIYVYLAQSRRTNFCVTRRDRKDVGMYNIIPNLLVTL